MFGSITASGLPELLPISLFGISKGMCGDNCADDVLRLHTVCQHCVITCHAQPKLITSLSIARLSLLLKFTLARPFLFMFIHFNGQGEDQFARAFRDSWVSTIKAMVKNAAVRSPGKETQQSGVQTSDCRDPVNSLIVLIYIRIRVDSGNFATEQSPLGNTSDAIVLPNNFWKKMKNPYSPSISQLWYRLIGN